MSQPLQNANFTYYGFHLRTSLNQGDIPLKNASYIWEQLAKIPELNPLKNALICYAQDTYKPELENLQGKEYLTLLKNREIQLPIPLNSSPAHLSLKSTLTPYRLHDTYAVDLTLYPEKNINLDELKYLNPQTILTSFSLTPSLGSSFLFYGEPLQPLNNYLSLGKDCLTQLLIGRSPLETFEETELLGCPAFIYDNGEIDPEKNISGILWFNPNLIDINQIDRNIFEVILYLFWYYHKILFAYYHSRKSDQEARKIYTQIEENVNQFNKNSQSDQRLEEFKTILLNLPKISMDYSQHIRDIEDYKNTLNANLINLKQRLKKLKENAKIKENFLENFVRQSERFIQQIETDLSFVRPGEIILQRLTDNIRAIIAIEQVKQDEKTTANQKKIERLIAYLGLGLAVSSISSSVMPNGGTNITQNLLNLPLCKTQNTHLNELCLGGIDITFHLLLGLILAFPLTGLLIRLLKKKQQ